MFRVLVRLVVPRRQAVAVWGAVGHGALGPAPPHLGHEEVQVAACDAPAVWEIRWCSAQAASKSPAIDVKRLKRKDVSKDNA